MSPWTTPARAPDLVELDTLAACAAEGSFAGAAVSLGISRPAVAKRIGNLEALAMRPMLLRDPRGVRLTDDGAALLASARRMLDERDVLVGVLADMRTDNQPSASGLRDLLGYSSSATRAAQRPEAVLAEAERVLELVLRSSATGITISDPDTAVVHEANDAFCRFVGRPREELVGKPANETGTWHDPRERAALVEELRRTGKLERVLVRVRRPDGTTRAGETSAHLVPLGGSLQMVSTVEDVTDKRRLELERDGCALAYTAVVSVAAAALGGTPPLESVTGVLPQLRRSAEFATALLWDPERELATHIDGEEPWPALALQLARSRQLLGEVRAVRSSHAEGAPDHGLAIALPALGQSVVLLSSSTLPDAAPALLARALSDLADVVAAAVVSYDAS